jgi:rare lipoprotein A (peptidoglycan hydrolase)
MSWSRVTAICILLLGSWATMNVASAQTFEDRWSPIPKAHAEPAPAPAQQEPDTAAEPPADQARSPEPPRAEAKPRPAGRAAHRRVFTGRASYYSYHGGRTASGQSFNPHSLTAAHRSLPFGTRLRVTDVETNKSVEVVVTDRGPVSRKRVLDLSLGAAKALDIGSRGVIRVRAEIISG